MANALQHRRPPSAPSATSQQRPAQQERTGSEPEPVHEFEWERPKPSIGRVLLEWYHGEPMDGGEAKLVWLRTCFVAVGLWLLSKILG